MSDDREELKGAEYLGDGAYVRYDQFGDLVIFTHNGIHATNSVVLGHTELAALLMFLRSKGVDRR